MIRVLFMIAAAGFVLSVGTLSAAVAIGGPEAIARGGWHMFSGDWGDWDHHAGWRFDSDDDQGPSAWGRDAGPQTSRTLAWSGADHLDLDLPADVRYVQADGPGTVTVTGPKRAVDQVTVQDGSLRYERHRPHWRPKLSIVVRAPNVSGFGISGANTLVIENYRQKTLRLDVSGVGEVTATGETDEVDVDMSGKGQVDLGALKARGANVDISGAAQATIAPTERAKLEISGAGDIRLLTRPAQLETDISGAGTLRQGEPVPPPKAKGDKPQLDL